MHSNHWPGSPGPKRLLGESSKTKQTASPRQTAPDGAAPQLPPPAAAMR